MPTFVKAGYWEKLQKGYKGWLNLDDLFGIIYQKLINPTNTISSSSTIDLSSFNSSLSTAESSVTITISYSGNIMNIELVLLTTSSSFIFPLNTMCVSEGIPSGDNILLLSGVSGDTYIIAIEKIGSTYYVVSKNFEQ